MNYKSVEHIPRPVNTFKNYKNKTKYTYIRKRKKKRREAGSQSIHNKLCMDCDPAYTHIFKA